MITKLDLPTNYNMSLFVKNEEGKIAEILYLGQSRFSLDMWRRDEVHFNSCEDLVDYLNDLKFTIVRMEIYA